MIVMNYDQKKEREKFEIEIFERGFILSDCKIGAFFIQKEKYSIE